MNGSMSGALASKPASDAPTEAGSVPEAVPGLWDDFAEAAGLWVRGLLLITDGQELPFEIHTPAAFGLPEMRREIMGTLSMTMIGEFHTLLLEPPGAPVMSLDVRSRIKCNGLLVYSPRMHTDTLRPLIKHWLRRHPDWDAPDRPAKPDPA